MTREELIGIIEKAIDDSARMHWKRGPNPDDAEYEEIGIDPHEAAIAVFDKIQTLIEQAAQERVWDIENHLSEQKSENFSLEEKLRDVKEIVFGEGSAQEKIHELKQKIGPWEENTKD